MCANGIRAFAKYVRDRGLTAKDAIRVETLAGIVTPRWLGGDQVEVEMTRPVLEPAKIPTLLRGAGAAGATCRSRSTASSLRVCAVVDGQPALRDLRRRPGGVSRSSGSARASSTTTLFPERVNVEFVGVRSRTELVQRTWERGSGETLACGSGACAVGVAGVLSGRAERDVRIRLRGGTLRIRWPDPTPDRCT